MRNCSSYLVLSVWFIARDFVGYWIFVDQLYLKAEITAMRNCSSYLVLSVWFIARDFVGISYYSDISIIDYDCRGFCVELY